MSAPAPQRIPADIVSVADYERHASQRLPPAVFDHIAGGSGDESTLRENRQALDNIRLYPRLLTDMRAGHTRLELYGQTFRHPILLAPVAFQALVHPHGELATAQAASATDTGMICSTLSSFPLEAVARECHSPRWFQLYFQPHREHTLDLVRRAEGAGFQALVVTLDTVIHSGSRRARRAGFRLPEGVVAENLVRYPPPQQRTLSPDDSLIFQGMMSEAPTWADMEWLIQQTRLPVLIKGVMHPADATRLATLGISGMIVSNHGGRALDHAPASISLLPAIREAVGPDMTLLLDGSIRSGQDAFKALALGANAVCVGRPQIYALAVAGALGVAHMIKLLREELELCMAQTGCPTLKEIKPDAIATFSF